MAGKKKRGTVAGRRTTKGRKKHVTRDRRRAVARMLAKGESVETMAVFLGCGEHTVRQHVRALRRDAERRAAKEWTGSDAPTADLLEAMEAALQKVRRAQQDNETDRPNYRELIRLEVRTIRELIDMRREAATREPAPLPDDERSIEELLESARELGIDTTWYEEVLGLRAA